VLKIDYKFSTVCEKNDKMSGPLGGFFWLTLYVWCRKAQRDRQRSSVYSILLHQSIVYCIPFSRSSISQGRRPSLCLLIAQRDRAIAQISWYIT